MDERPPDDEEESYQSSSKKRKESKVDHTYSDYSQHQITADAAEEEASQGRGRQPTFPAKLHEIVSNPEYRHIIGWMPHGRSWIIVNKDLLIKYVLPTHFTSNKFESFNRQVNGWGFKRFHGEGPDHRSYYHELFLRGRPDLTSMMTRLINPGKRLPDIANEPDLYYISRMYPLSPGPSVSIKGLPRVDTGFYASQAPSYHDDQHQPPQPRPPPPPPQPPSPQLSPPRRPPHPQPPPPQEQDIQQWQLQYQTYPYFYHLGAYPYPYSPPAQYPQQQPQTDWLQTWQSQYALSQYSPPQYHPTPPQYAYYQYPSSQPDYRYQPPFHGNHQAQQYVPEMYRSRDQPNSELSAPNPQETPKRDRDETPGYQFRDDQRHLEHSGQEFNQRFHPAASRREHGDQSSRRDRRGQVYTDSGAQERKRPPREEEQRTKQQRQTLPIADTQPRDLGYEDYSATEKKLRPAETISMETSRQPKPTASSEPRSLAARPNTVAYATGERARTGSSSYDPGAAASSRFDEGSYNDAYTQPFGQSAWTPPRSNRPRYPQRGPQSQSSSRDHYSDFMAAYNFQHSAPPKFSQYEQRSDRSSPSATDEGDRKPPARRSPEHLQSGNRTDPTIYSNQPETKPGPSIHRRSASDSAEKRLRKSVEEEFLQGDVGEHFLRPSQTYDDTTGGGATFHPQEYEDDEQEVAESVLQEFMEEFSKKSPPSS
mmetsp:Transcript_2068/g.3945  ORF Transcript_2068/g.3945 Transcript_2068/m.3945 type:complete len:708 (+) Transcript_2068:165-2288(+)